jgi:hypothetical protein
LNWPKIKLKEYHDGVIKTDPEKFSYLQKESKVCKIKTFWANILFGQSYLLGKKILGNNTFWAKVFWAKTRWAIIPFGQTFFGQTCFGQKNLGKHFLGNRVWAIISDPSISINI